MSVATLYEQRKGCGAFSPSMGPGKAVARRWLRVADVLERSGFEGAAELLKRSACAVCARYGVPENPAGLAICVEHGCPLSGISAPVGQDTMQICRLIGRMTSKYAMRAGARLPKPYCDSPQLTASLIRTLVARVATILEDEDNEWNH